MGHVVAPVAVHPVAHAAHQLQQCHVGQGAAVTSAGEEVRIVLNAGQDFQNAHGGVGEGNPMFSRQAFIRSAGTVQTVVSRSISLHCACSTSLVRGGPR